MTNLLELKRRIKNTFNGINKRANDKINTIEVAIEVRNENAVTQ
jgi:hypothetical protein